MRRAVGVADVLLFSTVPGIDDFEDLAGVAADSSVIVSLVRVFARDGFFDCIFDSLRGFAFVKDLGELGGSDAWILD